MKISLLINMKMPTFVGIFISISRENFMFSWVEHEKSFITLGPCCLNHTQFVNHIMYKPGAFMNWRSCSPCWWSSRKGLASLAQSCASDWWSGDCGFDPHQVSNILSWRLIMKYFLWSFFPFCWFKKGSCQFVAKECAQYWLPLWRTRRAQ